MKLELKHLAPYLPYDLICTTIKDIPDNQLGYNRLRKGEISRMKGIYEIDNIVYVVIHSYYFRVQISFVKPIFHPLSDLTKPIKVEGYNDGKEFVPLRMFDDSRDYCDVWGEWIDHAWDFEGKENQINIKAAPYAIMEELFQWHFDVFGLIEKGLAVDIDKIKTV